MHFTLSKIFPVIFFFWGIYFSTAQDTQLSLSLENPTYSNPALGGTGGTVFGASLRNQWSKIPGAFRTNSAYFDFLTYREVWSFSASFINSKAGSALTRNDLLFSAAYHQQYTDDVHFHYGIGLGFIQQSLNTSALIFMDQFNEDGESNLSSAEGIGNVSKLQPDIAIGAGLEYKNSGIALSAKHLNNPDISFLDQNLSRELPVLLKLQLGQRFILPSQWRHELRTFISYTHQGQTALAELDLFYRFEFVTGNIGLRVNPLPSAGENMHTDALKIGAGYRQDYLSVRYYYNHALSQQSFLGSTHEIAINFLFYRPRKFESVFSLN